METEFNYIEHLVQKVQTIVPKSYVGCFVCLSDGRTLRQIHGELHDLICTLFGNDQMEIQNDLSLCWECIAVLRKSVLFKAKLIDSLVSLRPNDSLFCESNVSSSNLQTVYKTGEDYAMHYKDDNDGQRTRRFPKKTVKMSDYILDELTDDESNEKYTKTRKEVIANGRITKKTRKLSRNKCSICKAQFSTYSALRTHRRNIHREKKKCNYCGREFTDSGTFKNHLLLHTGMPLFACSVCGKKYRGRHGLRAHERTHTSAPSEDSYCVDCNKSFKSKYLYRHHLKSSAAHNDPSEFRFPCTLCDKRFHVASQLRSHEDTVHLRKKDHKCGQCEKAFSAKYKLTHHIKVTHEGIPVEKKHICETCGKGFTTRQLVTRHAALHSTERAYKCNVCMATFKQPAALYTHTKLLHGRDK